MCFLKSLLKWKLSSSELNETNVVSLWPESKVETMCYYLQFYLQPWPIWCDQREMTHSKCLKPHAVSWAIRCEFCGIMFFFYVQQRAFWIMLNNKLQRRPRIWHQDRQYVTAELYTMDFNSGSLVALQRFYPSSDRILSRRMITSLWPHYFI